MKVVIIDTILRYLGMAVIFNAFLIGWLCYVGVDFRLSAIFQPIVLTFAMIAAAPFEKKHTVLGLKFFGFLAAWLSLAAVTFWLGSPLSGSANFFR